MIEKLYRARWNQQKRENIALREFLDFAENIVSFFSLSDSVFLRLDENSGLIESNILNANEQEYKDFCSQLNPFKISSLETVKWVCVETTKEYAFTVKIYSLNNESRKVLLNTCDNILMQDKEENCLRIPQNICFFRADGTFLLGTVSHEDMIVCSLRPEETNLIQKFDIFELCKSDFFKPKLNLMISVE